MVEQVGRTVTWNGIREWELDQCKSCGQNRISVGVIFLKLYCKAALKHPSISH